MSQYTTVDGYKFDAQINYGWGLTLNMTGKAPEVSKRIFDTYEHMMYYVNDYNDSCIEGLTLTVMADGEKNGVYFVDKIGTEGENKEFANDGHVVKLGGADAATEGIAGVQSALDAEIAARKAVDGQNGQTYVANKNTNYISEATSLNDADIKLDSAIKVNADAIAVLNGGVDVEGSVAKSVADVKSAIEGELGDDDAKTLESINDELNGLDGKVAALENNKSFVKELTVNGVDATIANNKATVTIDGSDISLSTDYANADYANVTSANLTAVNDGDSIDADISKLESNIVKLTKEVLDNESVCSAAITKLNEELGFDENAEFVVCEGAKHMAGASSISDALCKLDTAIEAIKNGATSELGDAIEALNVTDTAVEGQIVVSVSQENGIVSNEKVRLENIVLSSESTEDIKVTLGDKIDSIEQTIADNKAACEAAAAAATSKVSLKDENSKEEGIQSILSLEEKDNEDGSKTYELGISDTWDCGTFEYTK